MLEGKAVDRLSDFFLVYQDVCYIWRNVNNISIFYFRSEENVIAKKLKELVNAEIIREFFPSNLRVCQSCPELGKG